MAGRIATVSGTMLVPGVSKNRRLYTKELIAKAVGRMQERISDPDGLPILVRTHHEAGDDSVRIVGRIASIKTEEDGSATYRADLYDTTHGRDIATLVVPERGQPPALRSVSIHGYWLGKPRSVRHEGETVTTGDDLEIDAVDFTGTPGVLGATVTSASWVRPGSTAESAGDRTPISETVEATVEAITEEAPVEESSAKQKRAMLAKGQAMRNANGEPSYTIKSKADLRRAIKAVGRGGADHDKIRAFIIKRATALGLSNMIPDNWNKDGSMKENSTRLGEIREYYPDGPGGGAGFCIDAYNGPISLTMRACGIDPAELRIITAAAMTAAVDALQAMDPDMDADIDVDGAPNADTDDDTTSGESGVSKDDDMESAPAAGSAAAVEAGRRAGEPLTEADVSALAAARDAGAITPGAVITPQVLAEAHALIETAPPAQGAATTNTEEEAAMGEPTTETRETEAAPARSLTDADISALGALFGAALKENLAPVLAAVSENAPKPGKAEAAESVDEQPAKESKKAAKVAKLQETVAELQASFDTKLTEALAKQRDELREELLKETGTPPRKGYRVHENDQSGGEQPTDEELFARRAEILLGDYAKVPQPAQ